MAETIEFTSRIFGRCIEMHALVILGGWRSPRR